MSDKKIKLIKGKFYIIYGAGTHPALIFRKNMRKNKYDAIVFGTTPGKHRTVLEVPISKNVNISIIHNKPIRGTRKDFANKEFLGAKVDKRDKPKIELVKKKKPLETRRYKEYRNKKSTKPH